MNNSKCGYLVIEASSDGEAVEFVGELAGASVSRESLLQATDRGYGELVFNTSLTGYQEVLTDPSYYGQIVCMTAAHLGNTGVTSVDHESARAWCAGWVVQELEPEPSSWRSELSLDAYLKQQGVPALTRVDTRALTRWLRSRGVARALIVPESLRSEAAGLLAKLPRFEGRNLIECVSTPAPYRYQSSTTQQWGLERVASASSPAPAPLRVVAVDYGAKLNLLRSLAVRGCEIDVVPASTSAEQILALRPQGVFLSNGPGDPAQATHAIAQVGRLLGRVPIFGVCMGHQILALALGGRTYKLKFGHRGCNQPVRDLEQGSIEISSHNHGYAVDASSLSASCVVTHRNLNDDTVEGLRVDLGEGRAPAFSVQYHPESAPGPHDSRVLFDRFVRAMRDYPEARLDAGYEAALGTASCTKSTWTL